MRAVLELIRRVLGRPTLASLAAREEEYKARLRQRLKALEAVHRAGFMPWAAIYSTLYHPSPYAHDVVLTTRIYGDCEWDGVTKPTVVRHMSDWLNVEGLYWKPMVDGDEGQAVLLSRNRHRLHRRLDRLLQDLVGPPSYRPHALISQFDRPIGIRGMHERR